MTKVGSLFLTPSSTEISTIILPNALAGGTYSPPLSYLAPIQVQFAERAPLDEQTMYAFLPERTRGEAKFMNMVSPYTCESDSSGKFDEIITFSFLLLASSTNVNGMIICSNPSSLLIIVILCFF